MFPLLVMQGYLSDGKLARLCVDELCAVCDCTLRNPLSSSFSQKSESSWKRWQREKNLAGCGLRTGSIQWSVPIGGRQTEMVSLGWVGLDLMGFFRSRKAE